jgi:hypothetical protein
MAGVLGERIIPKIFQENTLISREIRSIQHVMDRIPAAAQRFW